MLVDLDLVLNAKCVYCVLMLLLMPTATYCTHTHSRVGCLRLSRVRDHAVHHANLYSKYGHSISIIVTNVFLIKIENSASVLVTLASGMTLSATHPFKFQMIK